MDQLIKLTLTFSPKFVNMLGQLGHTRPHWCPQPQYKGQVDSRLNNVPLPKYFLIFTPCIFFSYNFLLSLNSPITCGPQYFLKPIVPIFLMRIKVGHINSQPIVNSSRKLVWATLNIFLENWCRWLLYFVLLLLHD